jgi:hypothetical protein
MKALTLMITLALLTSAAAFADDGEDDISLYYNRMERNAQDWESMNQDQAKDPGEEIGNDGLPAFCHLVDPYKAYGSRVDTECKAKHPTILFNQKWENPNEQKDEDVRGGEGPGFVPVKHCRTGKLVSQFKFQQDCAAPVPTHGVCRSIGKDKNGEDIVRCK